MTQARPSFEELNAYVDNELPADRAADVAQAIARYPDVAEQVATLSRLRSVLGKCCEVPELTVPRAGKPRLNRPRWLVAACLGFLFVCAALLGYPFVEQRAGPTWLTAAWHLHDDWTPPPRGFAERPDKWLVQATGQGAEFAAVYVPDLSATKLSVVFVDTDADVSGEPAVVIGYTGTRGCKLTLIASNGLGESSVEPRLYSKGKRSAYGWRVGTMGHLLVADGMDSTRLDLIVQSIYRSSIERLPFDEKERTALLENRQKSKPCLA